MTHDLNRYTGELNMKNTTRVSTLRYAALLCATLTGLPGCGAESGDDPAKAGVNGLTPETGAAGPVWASNTDTSATPNVLVWDNQSWPSTPYSPVATRIDLVQSALCLGDASDGQTSRAACASPRWLLESAGAPDTYRLRSGRDTALCLELDPAVAAPKTVSCRSPSDASYARQVFALPVSAEGNRSLQNPASARCIVTGSGSSVTSAPCEITAPPASHRWTLTVAPHTDEHWVYVNEYPDTDAPGQYRYATSGASPTAQNLFVALTEPAADTLALYRNASGRLHTCLEVTADCGPIAFFTVRTPTSTQTQNRVPVYEFVSATTPVRYRYSTQLSVGAGFTRQAEPAFYAYRDPAATTERVYEVLVAAKGVATDLGLTALPELISQRDPGGVSYTSTGAAVFFYSSDTESPDREELLHVIGHVFAETMLGSLRDDDECLYAQNASLHSSDFHRPRDLLNDGWQPDTCVLREGWVEFFVTQMLPDRTVLPETVGAGADSALHVHGRRLFIVESMIALVSFAVVEVAWIFESHSRLSNADASRPRSRSERIGPVVAVFKALVPSPAVLEAEVTPERFNNANATTRQAASEVRATRPEITNPSILADADFRQELVDNPSSTCQVIDPADEWTYESCQTKRPILCGSRIDANAYALTQATYSLYDAVTACILEYGGDFEPVTTARKRPRLDYGALHSSGSVVPWGTGEARDASLKRRRLPPARGVKSTAQLVAALEEEVLDPDYDYLLVHSLNVGAGSCHIVQCVGSESVFADCGSMGSDEPILDAAGALAYAQGVGIFEADEAPAVVVSHPHRDHYNYLNTVFMGRLPEAVRFGGSPNRYHPAFRGWMTALRAANVAVNGSVTGPEEWPQAQTLVETFPQCGDATLRMVVVNTGGTNGDQVSVNRSSAVLRLDLPGIFSAILPGDAIDETEDAARLALTAAAFNRDSYALMTFLAASHHGASGSEGHFSNIATWVNYLRPSHLVYSSGDQHLHPRCDVVDRYGALASLGASTAHDVDCGFPPNAWQTRNTQRRHYSTRGAGSVVAGVAIPKPDTEGEPRIVFLTSGPEPAE